MYVHVCTCMSGHKCRDVYQSLKNICILYRHTATCMPVYILYRHTATRMPVYILYRHTATRVPHKNMIVSDETE